MNRIKQVLDDRNATAADQMTVRELADRTRQTERSVYRHLNNTIQPGILIALRYAAVLEVPLEDLVEGE